MILKLILTLVGFMALVNTVAAAPPNEELTRTIAALDTALFDAYNQCNAEKFSGLVSDTIEFYHDNDGLSVGKEKVVEALKTNICGKVRRDLVAGSMEVHPLGNFGALQIGIHQFHHPGKDDVEPVGQGKFVHIWQNQNGVWKLTRVISYDHRSLPK